MKIKTLILSILFLGAGFASAANQLALKGNTIYFEDPELGSLEIPAALLHEIILDVYRHPEHGGYCYAYKKATIDSKAHKNRGFEKLNFNYSGEQACLRKEKALHRNLKALIDDFISKNSALAKDDL